MSEFKLREAVNVDDLKERDRLVRRNMRIRAEAVQSKIDLEFWNRAHPDLPPFDTSWEDSVIAWCDGKGPMPVAPPSADPIKEKEE